MRNLSIKQLKALGVLKARILDAKVREEDAKELPREKARLVPGDRSGRIRTYNYPQGRMTDHRIGLTLYRLDIIMDGHIQEIIDELTTYNQAQSLKEIA